MKKHTAKLIRGNFSKEKAKILLLEFLSHKINYHQMQKFSNEERFGKDIEHSEKRIKELLKEKQDLTAWIDTLEESDIIKINCNIAMQVIDKKA